MTDTYNSSGVLDKASLLKKYQPLVLGIARKFKSKLPANVEVDDLIQVGMLGLYQSIDRFDPTQGVKFESFATQRIKGAMIDDLRDNDFMSRGLRKDQKEIAAAIAILEHELDHKPTEGEVASKLNLSLADYQTTLKNVKETQIVHLEDLSKDDDDSGVSFLDRSMGDLISDPLNILEVTRTRKALAKFIDLLPERSKQIMSMYYEEDMNLKEIAAVLTLTESRVSQLLSGIVLELRKKMKAYAQGLT